MARRRTQPLFREAVTFYKEWTNRLRLPALVWGAFALFGALGLGLYLGYSMGDTYSGDLEKEKMHSEKLTDLVDGYEDLSNLYHLQGQNLQVVMDRDLVWNHPEEVGAAFTSMEQYRNLINVQYGRILELRRQAGMKESEKLQTL